ncbi:MAG: thioredoxin family protein [Verrucomicrobia bacterium]|nr:thioredoxin family protein [Verrucomicrobiota bacterium]
MKHRLSNLLAGCAALCLTAGAAELKWHTDLAKAQALAKTENKKVLINFTGSDWCGFCIKLHKEVFATPEFQEFAGKNLVLVEADFPRNKTLPAELKAANEEAERPAQSARLSHPRDSRQPGEEARRNRRVRRRRPQGGH